MKTVNAKFKSYLAIPGLVVELTAPCEVRLVSLPQETVTGVLEVRAEAVIKAPRGGLVLLATNLDIVYTSIRSENKNVTQPCYCAPTETFCKFQISSEIVSA